MSGADLLATNVDMDVVPPRTSTFGGPSDLVEGLTVTPLGERFYGVPSDVAGNTYDPAGLSVYDFGAFRANSPELGLMLITNGDRGPGARGGRDQGTRKLCCSSHRKT